jgi:hypothetical protein
MPAGIKKIKISVKTVFVILFIMAKLLDIYKISAKVLPSQLKSG